MGSRKSSSKWNSLSLFFFLAIQLSLKEQEKSQLNNLMYQVNKSEKEQTRPKVSRMKGIIKITVEMHKRLNKTLVENINETRSWSFEIVTEIDK